MSTNHVGNTQPSIDREEHRSVNGVNAKAVVPYFFDGVNLAPATTPLANFSYDYVSVGYPDSVTEVYTFKTGGSGGTTVGTITVVYTTSSKEFIDNVTRS